MGLIPGPGRFHTLWSNYARAPQLLKPEHLEPMLHKKRNHSREKPEHHNQRVAPTSHS